MIDSYVERAKLNEENYKKVLEFYHSRKSGKPNILLFTCMDERIIPSFLFNTGIGDLVVIRNAGAYLSGDVIRSIVVAVFEKNIDKIIIVGHTDCGMTKVNPKELKKEISEKTGLYDDEIDYYTGDFESWIKAFNDPYENVKRSLIILRRHPLIPEDVEIRGFVFNLETASLEEVTI
ncbi:MAG: carbonic anhydrase [Candidatus Asgardarchaeum sp.]